MKYYRDTVLKAGTGLAVVGAIVTVYVKGTSQKAVLYASNDATQQAIGNPVATDTQGEFKFYVANGTYDIAVSSAATGYVMQTDVEIFDFDDIDARLTLAAGYAQGMAAIFASTAAGLADTPEGEFFGVVGVGGTYASVYQKVGGLAVFKNEYPSKAALNFLGHVPATVNNDLTVDNAIAINAALADPSVRAVILPPGVYYTRQLITVPSGKTLEGCGKGVTTLRAHPTIFANAGGFQAMVRSAQSAVAPVVRNLTVDGNKNVGGLKGVMMYDAKDFLVEGVEAKNCTSYNFWGMSLAGDATRCSGVFRDLHSYNCSVHFEVTNGENILWDNLFFGAGDGDIGSEAVYHVLGTSKNIIYRDGRGSIASGHAVSIVCDQAGQIDNIKLIRCDGTTTGDNVGVLISQTVVGASIGRIEFEDCTLKATKQAGMQAIAGAIKVRGGLIEGLSTAIQLDPTVVMDVDGTDLVSNTTGAITAFGVANNGGVFRMRGGSITPNSIQSSIHLAGGGTATTRIDRSVRLSGLPDGFRIVTNSSNHDLELADQNRDIVLNGGVAQQVRILPDSSPNMPTGTRFKIIAGDGAQKSVLPETGVTINGGAVAVTFTGAGKELNLLKIAANTWVTSS